MLGIVLPSDESRSWNERAMELARSSPDPAARRWIGSLANNMGWARHAEGDDDGAIALFELSRDAFLADGRADRARIARWSIARCLRSRGDVEQALEEQRGAAGRAGGTGRGRTATSSRRSASACSRSGGVEDARPFFRPCPCGAVPRRPASCRRARAARTPRLAGAISGVRHRTGRRLVLNHAEPDAHRAPDRHGHLPVHRHRGLDASAARARTGRVRRGARGASPGAARRIRRARRRRGRHAGRRVLRRLSHRSRCDRSGRRPGRPRSRTARSACAWASTRARRP